MEEENVQKTEAEVDLGKFKNVDALLRAYEDLEAEFTRRSQRLKELERNKEAPQAPPSREQAGAERGSEELYRAVMQSEDVRARVLSDYLGSLRGVPLMAGTGRGVAAPSDRPASIAEAGNLALGYFKTNSKGD